MSIIISTRNNNVSDTLKEYAEKKARIIVESYPKITSVRVIIDSQKSRYTAEIIVRGKELEVEATAESFDVYESVDAVIEKANKQLRRYIDKKHNYGKAAKLQDESESLDTEAEVEQ